MTPEEIRQKLKEAGIDIGGEWRDEPEKNAKSPVIERQKKLLSQVQGLLEQQVREDQEKVAQLHLALQRIKHGGGA